MKRYKGSTRWHQFVQWAIQSVTGQAVQSGETVMPNERYLQRAKLLRRAAWRDCAESRRDWRQED